MSATPRTAVSAGGHGLLWATIAVAAIVFGGVFFWLSREGTGPFVPRPGPTPVPTAPIVFPQPVIGAEPAGAQPAPTQAAAPAPTAPPVAEKKPEPEPVRPPRRFKVQFSSIPVAKLFVDGRKYGPSIPAKTVELPEGKHAVRFEAPGLPVQEKEFTVGPNGSPPIAYRFPVGYLVIRSPEWAGATILIDSKFRGVLTGDKSFQLSSGSHRVTLSREGAPPLTQEVTVEQGEKKAWVPPPPGLGS